MNVLVPNLGSTSLKYQILEMPSERVLGRGRMERVDDYRDAIRRIALDGMAVDAVAFKAVHGGARYRGTFVIDEGVEAAMERLLPAAPAHNAIYLTGIRAFREALPNATLVAAFETEFHATMPEYAARYGVPGEWREADEVRRYGFHGASHQYAERARTGDARSRDAAAGEAATWAAARRCARSGTAGRSIRRWGSRRSRDWRTPRVTGTSMCSPSST